MSLLDAFLRDAWQQPVVRSDVFFAYRTDSALGQGTEDDPWNGNPTTAPGNFDSKLNAVPANTTIHLGPGTFETKGYEGWAPKSGQRIVGAGIDATTIKLSGANVARTCAIGHPTAPPFLNGFELSDLTVDCNVAASNSNVRSIGAVALNGRHIYVRRLKVKGFGTKDTSPSTNICRAISVALSADGAVAEDCVIDSCLVVEPYVPAVDIVDVTCLHVGRASATGSAFHLACVIRDCFVDCLAANLGKRFIGIEASGGTGTIVESNEILNCLFGGPYQDPSQTPATIPTQDLVVRGNYYYNVRYGIYLSVPSSISPIGRVVLLENEVELDTTGTLEGLRIHGANTTGRFKVLVVHGNLIRHKDGGTGPSDSLGIRFNACTDAVVEDNVVNVATANNAVLHDYCTNVKVFNNQTSGGVFLPVYDVQTGKHDWELTNEAEDAFLVR